MQEIPTNPVSHPSPGPKRRRNPWLIAAAGLGIFSVVTVTAGTWFVKTKAGPMIRETVQTELTKLLKREVQVGEVERIGLTGLRFGKSGVPATVSDRDQVQIEAINANFSLWDVIIKRTLNLDINLIKPTVYIEEDAHHQWLVIPELPKDEARGLLKINLQSISVEKGNIQVLPWGETKATSIALPTAQINLKDGAKLINANADGSVFGANFQIKSEINQTNNILQLGLNSQKIKLPEIDRFLPIPNFDLASGEAEIKDLSLAFDWGKKQLGNLSGSLRLTDVSAQLPILQQKISKFNGSLRLNGQEIALDRLSLNYGLIPLQIQGKITNLDLANLGQTKLDVNTKLSPFNIKNVLDAVAAETGKPLLVQTLTGQGEIDAQIRGTVRSPLISGNIDLNNAVVDQVPFKQINTGFDLKINLTEKFALSSSEFGLKNLALEPLDGGKISGDGILQLKDLEQQSKPPIAPPKLPGKPPIKLPGKAPSTSQSQTTVFVVNTHKKSQVLNLANPTDITPQSSTPKLNANLELNLQLENINADTLANLYLPDLLNQIQPIAIGKISGEVSVKGPLEKLDGKIKIAAPQATFPTKLEIALNKGEAEIKEAIADVAGGTVNITGKAGKDGWNTTVNASLIGVDQLRRQLPFLTMPTDLGGILSSNINLSGPANNFSLANAAGNWQANLVNFAGGVVNLQGQLAQGIWNTKAKANLLDLEDSRKAGLVILTSYPPRPLEEGRGPSTLIAILQELAPLDGILDGEFGLTGNISNDNQVTVANITTDSTVKAQIANGEINAQVSLDNNQLEATIQPQNIGIVPLRSLVKQIASNPNVASDPNFVIIAKQLEQLPILQGAINGSVNATGNIQNINTITANANFAVNTNLTNLNAVGNLADSRWNVNVGTNPIALSVARNFTIDYLTNNPAPNTPLITKLRNLRSLTGTIVANANITGDLLDRTATEINTNAKVFTLGGVINTNANLANDNWIATIQPRQINVAKVTPLLKEIDIKLPQGLTGNINGDINLAGTLNNVQPVNTANAKIDFTTNVGKINSTANLSGENWQVALNTSPLDAQKLQQYLRQTNLLTAELPKGIEGTIRANAGVYGSWRNNQLSLNNGDGRVQMNTSVGDVNAIARLAENQLNATAMTNEIDLQYLRQIALNILAKNPTLVNNQKEVLAKLENVRSLNGTLAAKANFSARLDDFNLTAPNLTASATVATLGGVITGNGRLVNNNLLADFNLDQIALSRLEPVLKEAGILTSNLPKEVNGFINGNVELEGKADNLSLNSIALTSNSNLILTNNGGNVNIKANLNQGNWQADVKTNDILMSRFASLLPTTNPNLSLRGLLNSQMQLFGNTNNLSLADVRGQGNLQLSQLPVLDQALTSNFRWNGKQIIVDQATSPGLVANGAIDFNFPREKPPEIANLDFNVNVQELQLANLNLPASNTSSLLTGGLSWAGKIQGKPSNLNAGGDVILRNLSVNGVKFDPLLTGPLKVAIGTGATLQLKGETDRIELALNEDYLPNSFLVKRDQAIAKGEYVGDKFKVNLADFPLALLNIAPASAIGISGPVAGVASADVDVYGLRPLDLDQLKVEGKVAINRPAIGYIKFDTFAGNISYNNNVFNLTQGELKHGVSQYIVATRVDLLNPPPIGNINNVKFDTKIDIVRGNLQDILVALEYFNLADLSRGLKTPIYGKAADLQTVPVGMPKASVMTQLRRYAEISELIARDQIEEAASPIPPLNNLQADFQGVITASGSLADGITAQVKLDSNNLNWGQYVTNKFTLQAELANNVLTILPLEIQSGDAIFAFSGQITPDKPSGQIRVTNVAIEDLQNFVQNLPQGRSLDLPNLTGKLNIVATLAGTLDNPAALGELNIVDGTINNQVIQSAKGSFSYNNARLYFLSNLLATETEPVVLAGTIPWQLPFAKVPPDNDSIDIKATVKDSGLALINLVNSQISWVSGKGNVDLQVTGTLKEPRPQGIITLDGAQVRAQAFPSPLTDLSGVVRFETDRIRVENIQGNLSKGKVNLAGVLPVLRPLAVDDKDINQPLTVNLDKLALNLRGLYRGEANGQISVTNTATNPRLGGEIRLDNGQVFLTGGAGESLAPTNANNNENTSEGVGVGFNNLKIVLDKKMHIVSPPIVDFVARGDLTINGSIENIQPSGVIELRSGGINLYSTRMRLAKGYPQRATFLPNQGLDPTLNVRLNASVPETTGYRLPESAYPGEIQEGLNVTEIGRSRSVVVTAEVDGKASQLANSLRLSSFPRRSEQEIVGLLGGGFIASLSGGDSTLALANFAGSGLFSSFQQQITDATGLSEFRIFPARIGQTRSSQIGVGLEVGIDLSRNFSVSFVRILANNQPTDFSVRYRLSEEWLLRGATNFTEESRLSVEYEVRF